MGYTEAVQPGRESLKLTVPPFSFHEVPRPRDMASNLVCALPEGQRKEAADLLVGQILPAKLAGLEHHPRPQRLTAVVYKELARIISERPPNMRLHALKVHAVGTELMRISRDGLHVAIVRFLFDNTGDLDAEKLERWITEPVQELRMLAPEDLVEIVGKLRESLEGWKKWVTEEHPGEWHKHRVKYLQTQATLDAAAQAKFDSAAGSLYEFLCDADRQPTELTFDQPS